LGKNVFLGTLQGQWIMAWTISKEMESVWLATQTQTAQDVLLIGRAPHGVVLGWGQDLFLETTGNKSHLL
jgi:hypothetical protein